MKGKAAHAGMEPEKGISAIRVLSEIITRIPHGRIDRDTTSNAGIISGGKATNIVAESAYCKLEIRSIKRRSFALLKHASGKRQPGPPPPWSENKDNAKPRVHRVFLKETAPW